MPPLDYPATKSFALALCVALALSASACGESGPDTYTYLSQRNSGLASTTDYLAAGTYAVRLTSAKDSPGALFLSDTSQRCRYEIEVIQTTDEAGNQIFDGRRTSGFRYIVRFRWIREASGRLDAPDLDGSRTLFNGDGPVMVALPETANYEIRARAGGRGRTDIESCTFAVELRRERD